MNLAMIDVQQMAAITGGDLEFQQELLETFSDDALQSIDAIKTALEQQDWQRLYQLAHKLKGASSSAAILRVPDLARQLESQAQTYDEEGSENHGGRNRAAPVAPAKADLRQLHEIVETLESTLLQLRFKVERGHF